MIKPEELSILAAQAEPSSKLFLKKNKKKLTTMDTLVHDLHQKHTQATNCLECANCCRTLGPLITDKDIERMAKHLRIKPSTFTQQYLIRDEDNDWVFNAMPCPFLMPDNYCMIYEARPKACREYPHTDRKRFYQIFNLSVKNTYTCPVVYQVIEDLKKINY